MGYFTVCIRSVSWPRQRRSYAKLRWPKGGRSFRVRGVYDSW